MLNGSRQSQRTCRRGPLALCGGSHGCCTHYGGRTGPAGGRTNSPSGENTSYLSGGESKLWSMRALPVSLSLRHPHWGLPCCFVTRTKLRHTLTRLLIGPKEIGVLHHMCPYSPVHNSSVFNQAFVPPPPPHYYLSLQICFTRSCYRKCTFIC